MKFCYLSACLMTVLLTACDDRGEEFCGFNDDLNIDFDRPQPSQKNLYLGFYAADYYLYDNDALQFTRDSLVMEVIGEDAFGIRIREYYLAGSPALSNPDVPIDTAYYSMKVDNDFITFDWTESSGITPRGRLFDYGVRYPLNTESYEFDKFGWKVFPSPEMPQFGVTGVVKSYQPIEENFGDCKVRYDLGTVFAHIERPTWIYQPRYGLIARYTEITSGSYAFGFILTRQH